MLAPEECRSRALPQEECFEMLELMNFEAESVTLDSCSTNIISTEGKASRSITNVTERLDIVNHFENEGSLHYPHFCAATPRSLPVSPNLSRCPSPAASPSRSASLLYPSYPELGSHSQPVSPVLSHRFSPPRSSPVSPGPSCSISCPSRHASHSISATHSSPVSCHVSPDSRPIHSLSKKRKGDSLMLEAPKKVRSNEGTRHSARITG